MKLFTAATAEEVTAAVVRDIVAVISRGPTNMGLATGRTFQAVYHVLGKLSGSAINPADITEIQIDEYVGISPADPCSFAHQLDRRARRDGSSDARSRAQRSHCLQ